MAVFSTLEVNEGNLKRRLGHHIKTKIIAPALQQHIEEQGDEYRDIVIKHIKKTPAWKSILGDFAGTGFNDLQAVFGLASPEVVLSEIEEVLREAITVGVIDYTVINIGISERVVGELLDIEGASYQSKGHMIPWLEWALFEKGSVEDYSIKFDLTAKQAARSRSGEAIMKKSKKGWDLDPSVRGVGTNFLAQATEDGKMEKDMAKLFKDKLVKTLRKQ